MKTEDVKEMALDIGRAAVHTGFSDRIDEQVRINLTEVAKAAGLDIGELVDQAEREAERIKALHAKFGILGW